MKEPTIFTANTYFRKPGVNASIRRRNEDYNLNNVAHYLSAIGFEITHRGTSTVSACHVSGVDVTFHYSESCTHVYKTLSVTRNGKKSNITTIRKIASNLHLAQHSPSTD